MFQVRKANQRGGGDHGWLKTQHSFSFGDYYDRHHMGFRSLRVINEDWVAGGRGFGMHPHRDMEIITYVLSGALQHSDSMGNGSVLKAGELQRMTAGSGLMHSEINPSPDEATHLYQIWVLPDRKGLEPGYEQKPFPEVDNQGHWTHLAGPEGTGCLLTIHQDAHLYAARFAAGDTITHDFAAGRGGWLQVVRGDVQLDGDVTLGPGDGVAIEDEQTLRLSTTDAAEVLLFDLK